MNYIDIICQNNGSQKKYPYGTWLQEIVDDQNITSDFPIVGAYVNNHICILKQRLNTSATIRFFDISDENGRRFYFSSLSFILYKAVRDCYPDSQFTIVHGMPNGYYCRLKNLPEKITPKIVNTIKNRVQEIINADVPFTQHVVLCKDAIQLFEKAGLYDKAMFFSRSKKSYITIYQLDNEINFFQDEMLPSTGYVKLFALDFYQDGMLLRLPDKKNPKKIADKKNSPKLFNIFAEHKTWGSLMNAKNIPQVNKYIENDQASYLIQICEALQEKKIAQIADQIFTSKARFVMVAGPSSSGKTTFSKRLSIQLATNGIHAYIISLDDYFVDRELTPRDENGDYDFECLEALDLELFNQHLKQLNNGEAVEIPRFMFSTGKRTSSDNIIRLQEHDILIIEGIHGLNPNLISAIPRKSTYLIFISALTQITIDRLHYISTTENRLIRRLVRDYRYRQYSAIETLNRWRSVRNGEDKNIFPFQENADAMFNSAMIYELSVLKKYAEPLLMDVPETEPAYGTAQRLLKILSLFKSIAPNEIPPTSILREFLDGSSFKY